MNSPMSLPIEKRNVCFQLYLDRKTFTKISEETGVALRTVKHWAAKMKWSKQRDEFDADLEKNFQWRQKTLLMNHRVRVTQKHLDVTTKMYKHIEGALDRKNDDGSMVSYTPAQINDLARAMKSTTEVDGKAVGITDKVDPLLAPAQQGGLIASQMIIQVGGMPQLAKPAVDIEEVSDIEVLPPFA